MMNGSSLFRDRFTVERKKLLKPLGLHRPAAPITPARQTQSAEQPLHSLARDPISELAHAEERFHQEQVQAGHELIRSGKGIDNASDLSAVNAAQDQGPVTDPHGFEPHMAGPAPLLDPLASQHQPAGGPLDPLATVPGFGNKPPGM